MHPQNTMQMPVAWCLYMLTIFWLLVERSLFWEKLVKCLEDNYSVATQFLEKPGDELTFFKRTMCFQHDGRLTIKTHHKHVQHLCELLELNPKLQNKKTPGHTAMDEVDDSSSLDSLQAGIYRTCVGVLLYLAADLPHCQHVVRYLTTYSTNPSERSFMVLKHLVGYLASHEDICVSLRWKGRSAGIYHCHNLPPVEVAFEERQRDTQIDSLLHHLHGCLLFSSSRTQKLVSLSSAEAEVYACSAGTSGAILFARLVRWLTNKPTTIFLFTDSSGARGESFRDRVSDVFDTCHVAYFGFKLLSKVVL